MQPYGLLFLALKEGHPEIGPKGIHVEFTSNASRGDKEAGPAVPIESARRGSLEIVTYKIARDGELLCQFWAMQWKTPVKQILQLCVQIQYRQQ